MKKRFVTRSAFALKTQIKVRCFEFANYSFKDLKNIQNRMLFWDRMGERMERMGQIPTDFFGNT